MIGIRTGNVIHIPFRSDLSREDEVALEAATEWILAELESKRMFHGADTSIVVMRRIAEKELQRPRDAIHRRWAELFIRETNEIEFDNVRPEIRKLAARGNVTVTEYEEIRCNSYERELLIPALDDEAFVKSMRHTLENCSPGPKPFVTYDKGVVGLYAPELLKRFSTMMFVKRVANTDGIAEAIKSGSGPGLTESLFPKELFRESGALSVDEMTVALKNIGFDLSCGACASQFYTGFGGHAHDEGCFTNSEARSYAETIDNIREALGQKATHYLVIADDVRELVDAVERESPRAKDVLRKIREQPGSGSHCQACSIEAEIGTEEDPHPVPQRFHTCPPPKKCSEQQFDRTPEGKINNCALANLDEERNCQVCGGNCPDRRKQ